jgi:hypothetical protein
MKKFILLIAFISLAGFTNAQTYYPLVDTTKLWSNLWYSDPGGSSYPVTYETNFIKFSLDTTIGLHSYKKVFQATDSSHSSWSEIGYIRENSSKKVYYQGIPDTIERLYYDFGASVGDTINDTINSWLIRKSVVATIDSVFIGNKYLKRFVLTYVNECSGEQWVESIGSLCGVLESGTYCNTGGTFRLLCYYENDTLEYSNPNFAGCYYNGTDDGFVTIELNGLKVNILPNPVTDEIQVISNQRSVNSVEIYNILGEKIYSLPLTDLPVF